MKQCIKILKNQKLRRAKTGASELAFSFLVAVALVFGLISCEKDLTLQLPEGEEKLVVEGHIEQGAPPVVVLTRSVPIFAPIDLTKLNEAFVHDAKITVSTSGQSVTLQEFSSAQLPPQIVQQIEDQYGISLGGSSGFELYFYSTTQMLGEVGKIYDLQIEHEGKLLTAKTSIPQLNPIDSLWTEPHPNPANDSLVTLWYLYKDPDTLGNTVRYFTSRNHEPFYPGYFSSVFTDELVNGSKNIKFPLSRGQARQNTEDINFDVYGYFWKGDTVRIRWCAIDNAHYRFWYTLEADRGSSGSPISSPVKIKSNINGGLGIWGGYGVSNHSIIIAN